MVSIAGGRKEVKSTYAELDVRREVLDAVLGVQVALDERGDDDALLAAQRLEERVGELGTGVRHREGRAACAVLGLDDLVAAELDAVDERSLLLRGNRRRQGRLCLGEERENLKAS